MKYFIRTANTRNRAREPVIPFTRHRALTGAEAAALCVYSQLDTQFCILHIPFVVRLTYLTAYNFANSQIFL